MNNKRTNYKEILEQIYHSVKSIYNENNLDVDDLIKKEMEESVNSKSDKFIFRNLVFSIHNAHWKSNSLTTFWKNHNGNYEAVFDNYDAAIVSKLKLENIKNKGLIKSDKRLQYCINAANFVVDIQAQSNIGIIEFFDKFAHAKSTVYERWALANIISQSIKGIGTALACDFLKGIGFLNYGKPDSQIKRIFERIGIKRDFKDNFIYSNEDFLIFQIIDYLAQTSNMSLFKVDKLLWLFATGYIFTTGKTIESICGEKPKCEQCQIHNCCDFFNNRGH